MDGKSRILTAAVFLAIAISLALTYYHYVVVADYVVYTDEEEVPDPADFVAYLIENVLGIPARVEEAIDEE